MNIDEIKYNFQLLSVRDIEDIGAKLHHYRHLQSGGNVYYLENEDTNCCFAIGFRTLPEDSTGVCHIIEHSLLCGSKKYPLKEPFVNLLKTSLSTFLNAFTASDWTMYPFASQTPKDFDNILKIYCDAVFDPLVMEDPKAFLQEGWHLELNDKDELPSYKGVVYNEMIGAMSNVDQILTQTTFEAMYPDTCYRHNSGGDPEAIPSLTYEKYREFYREHYTPQNAMTYFYGKMDIEEKLKFLDEAYFSRYAKSDREIEIAPQEGLIDLNVSKEYEIGEEESLKGNTYLSLCYGLDRYGNYEELMAMQILCDALLSKNDSPVKKALLDAGLGENVETFIDDGNIVPALHIQLQKTDPDKKEAFKQVFESAIEKIVEEGIDRKLLLASINYSEFKDKEMDMGKMPKGLVFAMNLMGCFNYRTDMVERFRFSRYYDKFRRELPNRYFENLLEKTILHSRHLVEVTLIPSKTLGGEKRKAMEKKMKAIKEQMSEEEIDALLKLNRDLKAYQNHVDTPEELATLPKLELKDIPSDVNYLDSKETALKGRKTILHRVPTNKIGYVRLYFRLDKVAFEDLPYVYLLKNLFLNSSTKNYSSIELTNEIKTYLGELSFAMLALSEDRDHCTMNFVVSASALEENLDRVPVLIDEVLFKSRFAKDKMKQTLQQLATSLRQEIITNGMQIAKLMARSGYSLEARYAAHCLRGPKLYAFVQRLSRPFEYRKIKAKLEELIKRIFTEENVTISLSGDRETLTHAGKAIRKLKLGKENYPIAPLPEKEESAQKEALIIPSGVSYNALAGNPGSENIEKGKYYVLCHIVNYDYLWSEVRVKGGAYGCGLTFNRSGDVAFGSYRDPNVSETYSVYAALPDYLKKFRVGKEEFENYIIGTIGELDFMTPGSIPSQIDSADIYTLIGIRKKDLVAIKRDILKMKQQEIRGLSTVFGEIIAHSSRYTIGNEAKIRKGDFEKVASL